MSLKIYRASLYETYGYGAFDEISLIISANTESEALGVALQEYGQFEAKHWCVLEMTADYVGVLHSEERGS